MRKGYHYTTKSGWEKIKKEGLKLYRGHQIEGKQCLSFWRKRTKKPKGIWLWYRDPGYDREDELGIVMNRMFTKNELQIIKLEVSYKEKEMYKFGMSRNDRVTVEHLGENGNWCYHSERKVAFIIEEISLSRIKKVREFDLYDICELPSDDSADHWAS